MDRTTIARRIGAVGVSLVTFGFACPALAQSTESTDLSVTATVTSNCTLSTDPVAFGNVNTVSGSNVDATGGITVTCTNGTAWSASADAGDGPSASLLTRRMLDGTNTLDYMLYTDSTRATVWGDGSGTTGTVASTGTGSAQAITIYGRIPSGQGSVPAGSYADTVSVTVTY